MTHAESTQRTQTLARIVGPFLLVAAATVATRAGSIDLLFPAFFQDAPLVLITGVFTLMAGLTMFAAHHHWDTPPAIAISVLGVLTTFRGIVLMLAPAMAASLASGVAASPVVPLALAVLVALLGAWLTFLGWFAKPAQPKAPT
ncbi:hypothetical protein U91I_01224 [alpha proteobacterium U9-1i]|nr:hypothetical protein U91I_01224 [alpha proteobacterium U9-1i]